MIRKQYDNPRYPHEITITRLNVSDVPFSISEDEEEMFDEDIVEESKIEDETIILYHGIGRVFTDTTVNGSSKQDSNRRKASIPVRFDEWKYEILDGDKIVVRVGTIQYDGIIKDVEPDNNRTLVYWERNRT